jgi:hypothetical protein
MALDAHQDHVSCGRARGVIGVKRASPEADPEQVAAFKKKKKKKKGEEEGRKRAFTKRTKEANEAAPNLLRGHA